MEKVGIKEEYKKFLGRKISFIIFLVFLIFVLGGTAVGIGPMKFSFLEVYTTILHQVLPKFFTASELASIIILKIRIPRVLMALLAGFGLATAGVQMQAILRNPLASPFTLGISAGAALGASLAIIIGVSFVGGEYFLIGNAFLFSLIPAFVIFGLSRIRKATSEMMILVGIAMGYIFAAASTLINYFSPAEDLKALSVWMMGNLGRATWNDILPLCVVLALSIVLMFWKTRALNVMNAGDETAKSLGVNVERIRIFIMTVASLMTASIVCFTGMIGFVGLVAPHITRMIIGGDNRFLIPASGLLGAVFLIAADMVSVKIIEPAILPVGVVTAFLGGPLFLYLIVRKKRRGYW